MKKVKGDLVKRAQKGDFDVIVHGCNCFCTMGAGIAKTIKEVFPEAYEADLKTIKGDKNKLGTISVAKNISYSIPVIIVNAYTQYNFKGVGMKADYEAIRKVFGLIREQFADKRIGYPAIGAGLAGGDWNIIAQIIDEELTDIDHTFVEYSAE